MMVADEYNGDGWKGRVKEEEEQQEKGSDGGLEQGAYEAFFLSQ